MSYVAYADRDHEQEHHDPDTFITKYIWSQDHKVIAIQYGSCSSHWSTLIHIFHRWTYDDFNAYYAS